MRKYRRIILSILVFFLLPNLVLGQGSWEKAYIDFMEDGKNYRNHFRYNIDPLRCFIFDLDGDELPELIIHNLDEEDFSYNIYSFVDGRVKRIFGEKTLEGQTYFSLTEDGRELLKVSHEGNKIYHDRLSKIRNRVLVENLAMASSNPRNELENLYFDGDEMDIDEETYRDLTDSVKLLNFSDEDIISAIENYKESSSELVDVNIDGENYLEDLLVVNRYGHSYYPFRALIEGAGGSAFWDPDLRIALGSLDGSDINFPIDSNLYEFNGEKEFLDEDRVSFIYKDRTYVPIRSLMEPLGFKLIWKGDKKIDLIR